MYGARPGKATRPPIDAVFTTCPGSPRATIPATNASIPCTTPPRLTPSTQVPLLARELPRHAGELHAGVVAQHVHRAEALDDPSLERGDLVPLHDVRRNGEHLGAGVRGESLRGGVEPRRVDVGHHDPHALGRERLAERESDPAGGAGDDGDLAGQLLHQSFLKMSVPPTSHRHEHASCGDGDHDERGGGDLRVQAVPVVVVEDRPHHVLRRRAHQQRRGELVREQDEHQRARGRERSAHQRREDLQVRPHRTCARDARRLDIRVAESRHPRQLHARRERDHERDVDEHQHPLRSVEDEGRMRIREEEADAEDHRRDAERQRHSHVEGGPKHPELAPTSQGVGGEVAERKRDRDGDHRRHEARADPGQDRTVVKDRAECAEPELARVERPRPVRQRATSTSPMIGSTVATRP